MIPSSLEDCLSGCLDNIATSRKETHPMHKNVHRVYFYAQWNQTKVMIW